MAELSKEHGNEMFHKGDDAHLKAMIAMQELIKKPAAMQKCIENKKSYLTHSLTINNINDLPIFIPIRIG